MMMKSDKGKILTRQRNKEKNRESTPLGVGRQERKCGRRIGRLCVI